MFINFHNIFIFVFHKLIVYAYRRMYICLTKYYNLAVHEVKSNNQKFEQVLKREEYEN